MWGRKTYPRIFPVEINTVNVLVIKEVNDIVYKS